MGGVSSSIIKSTNTTPLPTGETYKKIENKITFDDLKLSEKEITPIEIEKIKDEALVTNIAKEQQRIGNEFSYEFQKLTDILQTTMILQNYSEKNKVIIKALEEEINHMKSKSKNNKEYNRSKMMTILQNSKTIDHYHTLSRFLLIVCIVLVVVGIAQLIMHFK